MNWRINMHLLVTMLMFVVMVTLAMSSSSSTSYMMYSSVNDKSSAIAHDFSNSAVHSSDKVYNDESKNNDLVRELASLSSDTITTIAGTGASSFSGDNVQATAATLWQPYGVALDTSGNVYIGDFYNNRIRKVTVSTGIITTIAGTGSASYSGDNGLATSATLNQPTRLALDQEANVYIADWKNHRIRKVTASTGIITTIAGSSTSGSTSGSYSGDNGQATAATLNYPYDVALDSSGNVYIADYFNNRIRKVMVSTGIITTIAGTGTSSFSGDNGQATSAELNRPTGVVLDSEGNVYIADTNNHRIRKLTVSTGIITTIAGTGTGSYSGDNGQATAATLNYPYGVTLDSAGNIYIADQTNQRVRKVTVSTGIVNTLAGNGGTTYSGENGPATSAGLNYPVDVAVDTAGNLYIADYNNNRIRKVTVATTLPTATPTYSPSSTGVSSPIPSSYPSLSPSTVFIIATIAGTGSSGYSGDNGQATSATMRKPYGISVDQSGNVYIADYDNHRIRKVTVSTGIITTVAGTGTQGYYGDNVPATSAKLNNPSEIALDSAGNVFIADTQNHRIRKVTVSTGIISTLAGSSTSGSYSGDGGQATAAGLNNPYGVTVDASGNIYIADQDNHRIRKVTVSTGIITTFAGTGIGSYSGDNGQATSAKLNKPSGVVLDSAGNIFFADFSNNRIRKVTVSTGIITTVAGTGSASYSGDNGLATSATLQAPFAVDIDAAGNVYIADQYNHRVRKVTTSTGIITTFAGTGAASYSGDNVAASSAALYNPSGVASDSSGNVYIADTDNFRIRKVTAVTPSMTPTRAPSCIPTYTPSNTPSVVPSTQQPSYSPSKSPTVTPTTVPSVTPTNMPSMSPTFIPTSYPTFSPSTNIITTIAGTGSATYSGDNGAATSAYINYPYGVALDASGNVYIAERDNHRIRKVTVSTGIITTIAGSGTSGGYNGNNDQATSATLHEPRGLELDAAGNVYIADSSNNCIRKVTVSTGIITTIAGSGSGGYNGDNGPATSAELKNPRGVALDASGNIYIADSNNDRIRKVTVSTGIITTIAGTGSASYSGDNGPATSAALNNPAAVALDAAGNIFISDQANNRVRKVTVSTGIITTYAGTGMQGYSGDYGPATSAALNDPHVISLDAAGNIYIADTNNNRIRKVTVSTGIITTYAGTGTQGYSGDNGPATSATLNNPKGVTVDTLGNVYIGDSSNNRIRKVTVATSSPTFAPTSQPTLQPSSQPSLQPSAQPSQYPTASPTYDPTLSPSIDVITTIAGGFSYATSTELNIPKGVTVDSSGNYYIADTSNHRVRKVTVSTGIITNIAGTGTSSYSGDGEAATSAGLYYPSSVAIDITGNVYIADTNNHRIRKVTVSTGIITTFAGNGTDRYSGDNGQATSAGMNNPFDVALDSSGNVLIADSYDHRIRKVTISTGIITTIAGSSTSGSYSGDGGAAISATLNYPLGIALDTSGNSYIADTANNRIRKVTVSTGIITSIAGTGTGSFSGDGGAATSAALNYPFGVALDSSGNVYIADYYSHRIRKVTVSTGIISSVAGSGGTGSFSGDNGAATAAGLNYPFKVSVDSSGNVYIADALNNRIRKVTVSTGIISTIAGKVGVGDNGPATSASLYQPFGVALDSAGNLYIGDEYNNRIRKVTVSTGIITTVAGTGSSSYSGDNGQATSAGLQNPAGVAIDSSGNVYIADSDNHRVRKVTVSTGIITTIAGIGTSGYSGDGGHATSAGLNYPYGVSLDTAGNVYIADYGNHRIRKVTVSSGIITTFAGTGNFGYSDDNVQATAATLSHPIAVALDSADNVYIADNYTNRIRKVTTSTGIINSIAGTVTAGYSGDNGPATAASLNHPIGVALDTAGNIYIGDYGNNRVRKVTMSTGIITTIAGSGGTGSYSGDNGPATAAALYNPSGVAVDASGNVYIADYYNNRIRKVTVAITASPTENPTALPSLIPTTVPTIVPSAAPTAMPTEKPTYIPTTTPSIVPSATPTVTPTELPTADPSLLPTYLPSKTPSFEPTTSPTNAPSLQPTTFPTSIPPTNMPSSVPTTTSNIPTETPTTSHPTIITSFQPSIQPTLTPTTAVPSSNPTSYPTSTPTKLDIVAVNIFNTPLNGEVASGKIKFYLAKFAAYFLVIFVILLLLDYSKLGKRTVKMLHDSAFASEVYLPTQSPSSSHKMQRSNKQSKSKEVFSKLRKKDGEILEAIERQEMLIDMTEDQRRSSKDFDRELVMSKKFLGSNRLLKSGYSEGFYLYIDQRRTYLGCEPLLYPDGKLAVCNRVVVTTEKGVLEDFLVYLCNNHSMLNCIFAVDGAPVDRLANKLIYTTQNCIAFFMSAISGSVFAYLSLSSKANIVFDLLVTTPATIIIAKLIKALYTCPIGFSVDYQVQNPITVMVIQMLGRLTLVPIIVSIVALLILATMFSQGHNFLGILLSFFLQVQLFGFFLEIVFALLMFTSRFYMRCTIDLSIRSIILLEVGRRYTELIYHNGLVEGKDYYYRCYYLLCVLRIECIYKFDDAIKKGYVTEEDRLPDDDVELTTQAVTDGTTQDRNHYRASGNLYATYSIGDTETSLETSESIIESGMTSNPLHRTVNKANAEALARMNTVKPVDEVDECEDTIVTVAADSVAVTAQDTELGDVEYSVADEEYVLKKKAFKPETRNSFVEIFRKFEEIEQLATPSTSSKDSGLSRTEFMHNSLKKKNSNNGNVLAPKR